ncbi:MAG: LepB GTPase-activating domain-containing protein [Legionella longbeachae]|nr:LepB GTPase-activating domain-containing protein [Legionella longbeachae]
MVSFTEVHKLIGTSNTTGNDRDVMKEATSGSKHYPNLMKPENYFGLSTALMFSLLLGAHSVHSGNIVALGDEKSQDKQYGRIDWGDSFRYFAHPKNNDALLYAYENRGFGNYKALTKDYFLNYKEMPGLFPEMAKNGTLLKEKVKENILQDIVTSALKNMPHDLIDIETKKKFAKYAEMPSFVNVTLGSESKGGQFAIDMARILEGRLEKITHLQDLQPPTKGHKRYKSKIFVPPVTPTVNEKLSFPDLLSHWNGVLSENKQIDAIEKKKIDLSQLAIDFNNYLTELAVKSEQMNLWGSNLEDKMNIFVPFKTKKDGLAEFGHAFVPQYKEGVIYQRMFALDPKTLGTLRFAAYEEPINEYVKKFPESLCSKMQNLAMASYAVLNTLRLIQNSDPKELMENLHQQLKDFISLKEKVEKLLNEKPTISENSSTSFFYPISDYDLSEMTGDQLATICFEELNNPQPSALIARILKNDSLWNKLSDSLNGEEFIKRIDSPKEKISKINEWRRLLVEGLDVENKMRRELVVGVLEQGDQIKELEQKLKDANNTIEQNNIDQEKSKQIQEEKSKIQYSRMERMAPVLAQIKIIEKKAENKKDEEGKVARILVQGMREQVKDYIYSEEEEQLALKNFQDNSDKLILVADKTLQNNKEFWGPALAHLAFVVFSAGLGLVAMGFNKLITERFTFFSVTETEEQLGELKNKIPTRD